MKNREFQEKVEETIKWAFEQGYKAALEDMAKQLTEQKKND